MHFTKKGSEKKLLFERGRGQTDGWCIFLDGAQFGNCLNFFILNCDCQVASMTTCIPVPSFRDLNHFVSFLNETVKKQPLIGPGW
jgi:hypothetical protein